MRKSMHSTSILRKENFDINLLNNIFAVHYRRSHIIKEIEKLVLCVYGVAISRSERCNPIKLLVTTFNNSNNLLGL